MSRWDAGLAELGAVAGLKLKVDSFDNVVQDLSNRLFREISLVDGDVVKTTVLPNKRLFGPVKVFSENVRFSLTSEIPGQVSLFTSE